MGCYFLLQGFFLTQGSNLGLLHCRRILYYCSNPSPLYRERSLSHWTVAEVMMFRFLTHGNCEIIKMYCFESLSLWYLVI